MDDPIRFTYIGPAGTGGALLQELRALGFIVKSEGAIESRDLLSSAQLASQWFEVSRPFLPDIFAAVRKITDRFGSRVEGLQDEAGLIIQDRLAAIEDLRSDGTITEEEYADLRARILGES